MVLVVVLVMAFVWLLSPSRAALDRAAVLLSMKREMVRLDNVWGVGGGLRPVKHLVKEVKHVKGGASLFSGFPSFSPSLSPLTGILSR